MEQQAQEAPKKKGPARDANGKFIPKSSVKNDAPVADKPKEEVPVSKKEQAEKTEKAPVKPAKATHVEPAPAIEDDLAGEGAGEHADSVFGELGVTYIDRRGCLRCTHLVGDLGKKTHDCTAENGNTNCPASRYQIVIGMDVEAAMDSVVEAIQRGDLASAISVLEDVKNHEEVVVEDFVQEACDRLGVEPVGEEEDTEDAGEGDDDDDDDDDDSGEGAAEGDDDDDDD